VKGISLDVDPALVGVSDNNLYPTKKTPVGRDANNSMK
jgi:hypothetical protein